MKPAAFYRLVRGGARLDRPGAYSFCDNINAVANGEHHAVCGLYCTRDYDCKGFAFSKAQESCVLYWEDDVLNGAVIDDGEYALYFERQYIA